MSVTDLCTGPGLRVATRIRDALRTAQGEAERAVGTQTQRVAETLQRFENLDRKLRRCDRLGWFGSGRRGPCGPCLPHHRTYGSVYGGSRAALEASVRIEQANETQLA